MTMTRQTRLRVTRTGTIAALLGAAVLAGFPIFWMVVSSFKTNSEVFESPPTLITENFSLDAYTAVFTDPTKLRFFVNSYVVAIAVTLLTLLVAILAAYAFSRYDFKMKGLLSIIIIGVQAVPPITLLIPYFTLIVALRLYDSYAGLILTYMVFTVPYAVIMMTGYFNTIPRELDEAVKVDGAGPLTALFRVIVPVAMPGIVSVGVYTFMIAWNEYLFALTLTRTEEMRTLPIGIQLLLGQANQEWAQLMSMSLLGMLPVLILFLFFQRHFIGGLTSGAVKS
ncbi:carbohydrate ABC transporter permease [Marisediminicola sp. LYQ134]|uniref:carbohydrate ABC transporter permease n=1 Tax=Marisediminicola sp. LYQ134 TaxID=3391061 RepID=UPI0039834E6F